MLEFVVVVVDSVVLEIFVAKPIVDPVVELLTVVDPSVRGLLLM